jgi:hypothetical protein
MGILATIVNNVGDSGSGDHFLNEIIIGYDHIIRHYPRAMDYSENIVQILNRESAIQNPDSKRALLYLLGEYGQNVKNAHEIIEDYIEK